MVTDFLQRLRFVNLETGFNQYWCILLVTLEQVETCFDESQPEREQPGPVKRKRRVLSPRLVTAQISSTVENANSYILAQIKSTSLLQNICCINVAMYLVGRGHGTEDTTFKTSNGLFSFVPFQLASARQSILLHAIFRRSGQQQKTNYLHLLSRRQL
jgi:hypothetical protein